MRERSPEEHPFSPASYPALSLDDPAWEWFASACSGLGVDLPAGARAVLERLYSHLVGVNAWMNLTRLTGPSDYLKYHILDSLTALPTLADITEPGDLCLDLGSGGGYPGLPLMTWLADRRWVLMDSRQRKVSFLREAVRLTPCRKAEAAAFRAAEVRSARPDLAGKCVAVTARAVGRAAAILQEAQDLLQPGGGLLLLKGPSFAADEREEALRASEALGYTMVSEEAVTLAPGDPERLLVLFARTPRPTRHGRHPHRGGRDRPQKARPEWRQGRTG